MGLATHIFTKMCREKNFLQELVNQHFLIKESSGMWMSL